MTELEPMERFRVAAALGASVTLDADDIRAVLQMHNMAKAHMNRAEQFHKDGMAAYEKASKMHWKSIRHQLFLVALSVAIAGSVWVA